jgi:ribA/ribD-fused uncharacterized protein
MSAPDNRNWIDRYLDNLKTLAEDAPDDYTQVGGVPVGIAPRRMLDPPGFLGSAYNLTNKAVLDPAATLITAPTGMLMRATSRLPDTPVANAQGELVHRAPFTRDTPEIPFAGNDFDPAAYAEYARSNLEQSVPGQVALGMLTPLSLFGGGFKGLGTVAGKLGVASGKAALAETSQFGKLAGGLVSMDAEYTKAVDLLGKMAGQGLKRGIRAAPGGQIAFDWATAASKMAQEHAYGQELAGSFWSANQAARQRGKTMIDLFRPGAAVKTGLPQGTGAWNVIRQGHETIAQRVLTMEPERQAAALRILVQALDSDNVMQVQSVIRRKQLKDGYDAVKGTLSAVDQKAADLQFGKQWASSFERQAQSQYKNQMAVMQAFDTIEKEAIPTRFTTATATQVQTEVEAAVKGVKQAATEARRYAKELRGGYQIDPMTGIPVRIRPVWDEPTFAHNYNAMLGEDIPYREARATGIASMNSAIASARAAGPDAHDALTRLGLSRFGLAREGLEGWTGDPLQLLNQLGVRQGAIPTFARELSRPADWLRKTADEVGAAQDMVRERAARAITANMKAAGKTKAEIDADLPKIMSRASTALNHPALKDTALGATLGRVAGRYDRYGDLFDDNAINNIIAGRMQETFRREELGLRPNSRGILIPGIGLTALDQLHKVPGLGNAAPTLQQAWKQEAVGKLNDYLMDNGMSMTQAGKEIGRLMADPEKMFAHPAMLSMLKDDLSTAGSIALGTWKEQNLLAPAYHVANVASQAMLGSFAHAFGGDDVPPHLWLNLLRRQANRLIREGAVDNSIPSEIAPTFVKTHGGVDEASLPAGVADAIGEAAAIPGAEQVATASERIPLPIRLALFGGGTAAAGAAIGENRDLSPEQRAMLTGVGGLIGGLYGWKLPSLVKGNFLLSAALEKPARGSAFLTTFDNTIGTIGREAGQINGTGLMKQFADDVDNLANMQGIRSPGLRTQGPVSRPVRPAGTPSPSSPSSPGPPPAGPAPAPSAAPGPTGQPAPAGAAAPPPVAPAAAGAPAAAAAPASATAAEAQIQAIDTELDALVGQPPSPERTQRLEALQQEREAALQSRFEAGAPAALTTPSGGAIPAGAEWMADWTPEQADQAAVDAWDWLPRGSVNRPLQAEAAPEAAAMPAAGSPEYQQLLDSVLPVGDLGDQGRVPSPAQTVPETVEEVATPVAPEASAEIEDLLAQRQALTERLASFDTTVGEERRNRVTRLLADVDHRLEQARAGITGTPLPERAFSPELSQTELLEASGRRRPLRRVLASQEPGQAGIQHVGSDYGMRTDRNAADGDLTLALAADHTTGGERRTQRAAHAANRPMLMISHEPKPSDARRLVEALNKIADRGQNDIVLNVAGNGIATLARHGVGQTEINRRVHALLQAAITDPTARFRLAGIISGGQTGVDMAGLAAAEKLGIPALARVSGDGDRILVRLADNRDRQVTAEEFRRLMTGGGEAAPKATPAFRGERAFLSNFHPAPVTLDGEMYPTVEHAFVASRTTDPALRERIRQAPTPADAKRIGREVGLRRTATDLDTMRDLINQKFTSDPDLRRQLLATGDEDLIEHNTWGDRYWGMVGGTGENHLGRILMETRARLKQERATLASVAPVTRTAPRTVTIVDARGSLDASNRARYGDRYAWGGRRGPTNGKWGNPFATGRIGGRDPETGDPPSVERVIELYRRWLSGDEQAIRWAGGKQPPTPEELRSLEGKVLGYPGDPNQPNHLRVLAEFVDKAVADAAPVADEAIPAAMGAADAAAGQIDPNAPGSMAAMLGDEGDDIAGEAAMESRLMGEEDVPQYAPEGMFDEEPPALAEDPSFDARLVNDALPPDYNLLEQADEATGEAAALPEQPVAAAAAAEPDTYPDELRSLFNLSVEDARLAASGPAGEAMRARNRLAADAIMQSMADEGKMVPQWHGSPEFAQRVEAAGALDPTAPNFAAVQHEAIDTVLREFTPFDADPNSPLAHPEMLADVLLESVPGMQTTENFTDDLITMAESIGLPLESTPEMERHLRTLDTLAKAADHTPTYTPDPMDADFTPSMLQLIGMDPDDAAQWVNRMSSGEQLRYSQVRAGMDEASQQFHGALQQAITNAQQTLGRAPQSPLGGAAGLPPLAGGATPPPLGGAGGAGAAGGAGGVPPVPPAQWTWASPNPNFQIGPLHRARSVRQAKQLARSDMPNAPAGIEMEDYFSVGPERARRVKMGARFDAEAFKNEFADKKGQFSASEVYRLAQSHGATPQQAARLRAAWDDAIYTADQAGKANSDNIHVNYQDINNLIYYGRMGPFPFLTWQAAAIPKYLQILAHHPALAVALNEYGKATDTEVEEAGLPPSFHNFTQQGGLINAIASSIMGREGSAYANPLPAVFPYSDVGRESSEYASPMDRGMDVMRSLGLGPSPLVTLPAYMAGLTNDLPINMLRTSPMIAGISQLLTGHAIDPEELPKRAARAVRETVAPGATQDTITGDPIKDYYTRKRIASMAAEAGHQPTGEYLKAIQTGKGPIWENALRDVEREMGGRTLLATTAPVRWKLVDTGEEKIRNAQAEQGITSGAIEELNRQPLTREDLQYAAASLTRNALDRGETIEERARELRVSRRFGKARAAAPITGGLSGLGADPRSEARRAQLIEQEGRRTKPISARARAARDRAELTRGEAVLRQMGY